MKKLLLLLTLLLLPLVAHAQEPCVFSGAAGTWTNATTCTNCTITGCTLSAADNVTIASGAGITITTGSTVSMTTGAITVASGGTLTIQRNATLAIPDAGLLVSPGGTFIPRGSAISYGDATPSFVTTLSDGGGVDVNTVLNVGKVIQCPGTPVGVLATTTSAIVQDCNGDEPGTAGSRSQIAICYPDADVTADRLGGFQNANGIPGEQFYPEFLPQVAVGDVLVFWDSTNQNPSRDVNAQYEVDFVNTNALNRCIGLNVRQGSTESSCAATSKNCLFDSRDVREVTLTAAYVKGQTSVTVDAAAVTSTAHRAGHFLTCPADYGTGTVQPGSRQSVAIVHTLTGASDTLRLMPGGFQASVPNGSVCWIDYGWTAGDPFSIYKPARLTNTQNGTCIGVGNPVACCSAPGGDCGGLICGRGAICDVDFTLATGTGRITLVGAGQTMDNSWAKDQGSNRLFILAESAGPLTRVQTTSPRYDNPHTFGTGGGGNSVLTDVVARHWGDDLLIPNYCTMQSATNCSGGADPDLTHVHGFAITRMRAEYHGCEALTCEILDEGSTTGAISVNITDLLARDANDRVANTASFLTSNTVTPGNIRVTNAAFIASGGEFFVPSASALTRLEVRNVYDAGRILATIAQPLWRAHLLHDASLIGLENSGGNGILLNSTGLAGSDVSWNRILMLDPDVPGATPTAMMQLTDGSVNIAATDIAVISPNRTGQAVANSAFRIFSGSTTLTALNLNRFTVAMRPGEAAELSNAFIAQGTDATYDNNLWKAQNLLAAYMWGTTGTMNGLNVESSDYEVVLSPWCFQSNDSDTTVPAANLTSAFRDTRQQFVDPNVGNYQPLRSSCFYREGCGARKVGARDMWALRVLGHGIYNGYGDTWKTKGGTSAARGPRATP